MKVYEAKGEQVGLGKIFEPKTVRCKVEFGGVPWGVQRWEAILTVNDTRAKVDQLAVDLVAALLNQKVARFDVAVSDACDQKG